jgi:hypothetical protein
MTVSEYGKVQVLGDDDKLKIAFLQKFRTG